MANGENLPATTPAPPRWVAGLQWFGRRAIVTVLLVMFALWLHELFVDPQIRQAWKLKVIIVLAPLGALGAMALLVATVGEWFGRRR
jgi:hypothetical protein